MVRDWLVIWLDQCSPNSKKSVSWSLSKVLTDTHESCFAIATLQRSTFSFDTKYIIVNWKKRKKHWNSENQNVRLGHIDPWTEERDKGPSSEATDLNEWDPTASQRSGQKVVVLTPLALLSFCWLNNSRFYWEIFAKTFFSTVSASWLLHLASAHLQEIMHWVLEAETYLSQSLGKFCREICLQLRMHKLDLFRWFKYSKDMFERGKTIQRVRTGTGELFLSPFLQDWGVPMVSFREKCWKGFFRHAVRLHAILLWFVSTVSQCSSKLLASCKWSRNNSAFTTAFFGKIRPNSPNLTKQERQNRWGSINCIWADFWWPHQ